MCNCVFFFNLQVEQLHKIFKLCGSPPDEFWKKCKLPLATMFKPQTNYENSLRERCKGFPATAVSLIETLLSIDPSKRGTASSALMSEVNSFKCCLYIVYSIIFKMIFFLGELPLCFTVNFTNCVSQFLVYFCTLLSLISDFYMCKSIDFITFIIKKKYIN